MTKIEKFLQYLLLLVAAFYTVNALDSSFPQNNSSSPKLLSRRRRYVAFPDGSSLSAAICMTIGVIGNPNVNFLSWAVNWGVAYNLPNYAWAKEHANGFANRTKEMSQRRSRRDLYDKLQVAVENMGFNGQQCVERALCDGAKFSKQLKQRRGNMIEEIIKTIFTLPSKSVAYHEPAEHHHYDRIFRRSLQDDADCRSAYPECHFSLLELALGKYAVDVGKSLGGHRPMVPYM